MRKRSSDQFASSDLARGRRRARSISIFFTAHFVRTRASGRAVCDRYRRGVRLSLPRLDSSLHAHPGRRFLIFAALPFFKPLAAVCAHARAASSCRRPASIGFQKRLQLDEFFERKHKARVDQMRAALQRNELTIIIGWAFFPLTPTDVICYVCGALESISEVSFGILIGEGTICAIYIFLGGWLTGALF